MMFQPKVESYQTSYVYSENNGHVTRNELDETYQKDGHVFHVRKNLLRPSPQLPQPPRMMMMMSQAEPTWARQQPPRPVLRVAFPQLQERNNNEEDTLSTNNLMEIAGRAYDKYRNYGR